MEVQVDKASVNSVRLLMAGLSTGVPKALARSLNKTVSKAGTKSSAEIRRQAALKAAYVKSKMQIMKASQNKLTAKIVTPSEGVLLSRFSTNASISGDKVSWLKPPPVPPRGIRVKVDPSGGAKLFAGSSETEGKPFYMVLPKSSGRVAIVGRRSTPGPRGGKIKVFYGPSISQIFTDVKEAIGDEFSVYQMQQFEKEIDAILRGY
ncbi:phage tail protein [Marinobacter sp. W-8]|uniref:phage tail protein n=1 Tax=Marinobacter sp. W-8 TaxID=3369658 RepID=UPI0037C59CAB